MNRLRYAVGALVLVGSLAIAFQEAGAQFFFEPRAGDPRIPPPRAGDPNDVIRWERNRIDAWFNRGQQERQDGRCEWFSAVIRTLIANFGDGMIEHRARSLDVALSPAQRQQLVRYAESRAAALIRLECPPRTGAQTAQTPPPTGGLAEAAQILIEGGVSSTQDIKVGNGNFDTKNDATGPALSATLSVPVPGGLLPRGRFQVRAFGFHGNGSTDLRGNAGTFLQANSGNQPINLNITSGNTTTEISQLGGEGLFLFDHPMRDLGTIFSPLFGAGFERVTLDTKTSVQIATLGFHASDARTTVTDRVFITGGLRADLPVLSGFPGAPTVFVFGSARVNFDRVTGTAVYDTAQTGVFAELLHHEFSHNAVTFGGQGGAGVAWPTLNGGRLELKAMAASVPLHQLEFHPGQPATLEHSNHLNVTAQAALNIPFAPAVSETGPRRFGPRTPFHRLVRDPFR